MKGLILAAGRGSRIGPLTNSTPKCMLEIHSVPLLERIIESFRSAGINDIAIATGYLREQVPIGEFNVAEYHNHRWESSNMVATMLAARSWLRTADTVISYGDIFYHQSAVESLVESNDEISLTYDTNWHQLWSRRFESVFDDAETFQLDDQNLVIDIGHELKNPKHLPKGQFMGLFKIKQKAWHLIEEVLKDMDLDLLNSMDSTALFQKLISEHNFPIKGIPYSKIWGEIDTEKDLRLFNET